MPNTRTNAQRADSARDALDSSRDYDREDCGVRDLLCDLLHYAESIGMDPATELRAALLNYNAERAQ